ncbi:MAG: metallophosphoesterase [Acidobacteria bacterium]|nr:metallophosphoesterase [Acidobacteriota bacterium]
MLTRRKFLSSGSIVFAGTTAFALYGYSESLHPRVKRIEIPLKRLPEAFDGFTIAQLSDFHYERYFSAVPIHKSVEMVNSLRPDLVVLTGDFVTVRMFESNLHARRYAWTAAVPCAEILSRLEARMGRFAILGNHDADSNPGMVRDVLQSHGIHVLKNQSVAIERGPARIWLSGVDDALRGTPDIGAAIEKIPSNEAVVLLAHEPDFADEAALSPVDLQLSGHSHGGQIWIPGIGAPWLPPLGRLYPRGLYQIESLTLYTNPGIGTIHVPIRINCIPEVTLVTLRTARP